MTVIYSQLGKNGRLGNQLFQIASTIGIALKNNHKYAFPKWDFQNYFDNKLPFFNQLDVSKSLEESSYAYHSIVLEPNKDYDLNGYFQSYKYFNDYKDVIKPYFTPNFEFNTGTDDQVAMHVRRGDYLERSNFHTNLTLEYYNKAMSVFPNSKFVIFSDDIKWCIQNFDHDTCYFTITTELGDIGDLFYMSSFKNHIIANSSFSWWGSYLGNSEVTVAPKDWFQVDLDTKDLYLPEWIQI